MTGASAMRLTDGATESGFLAGNDNQMDVVGHRTKTPCLAPFFSTPVGYQIERFLVILIREEYLLPTVPSLRDVMRDCRHEHSYQARHGNAIALIGIEVPCWQPIKRPRRWCQTTYRRCAWTRLGDRDSRRRRVPPR
jgi:hypothetical protein